MNGTDKEIHSLRDRVQSLEDRIEKLENFIVGGSRSFDTVTEMLADSNLRSAINEVVRYDCYVTVNLRTED